MKKVIPKMKVSRLPFFEKGQKLTYEELQAYGIVMSNGDLNYYRLEFMRGRGGNYKEETWNRKHHWHNCCKSKVAWRHRINCQRLNETA